MSLIKCPACEKDLSPNAASCPHCGEPMRAPLIRHSFIQGLAALIMVGAVMIVVLHLWDQAERAKTRAMFEQNQRVLDEVAPFRANARRIASVQAHEIRAGMTESDVLASWGEPQRHSIMSASGIKTDLWMYDNGRVVLFADGIVQGASH